MAQPPEAQGRTDSDAGQGVALSTRVFESPGAIEPFSSEWDALAVGANRPFSAPAWVLAWWSQMRSEDAQLRTILSFDGDRVVGALPLVVDGGRYSAVGARVSPVEPLAKVGFEEEVAKAMGSVLPELTPSPTSIQIKRHESAPPWAELLGRAWSGRRGVWEGLADETTVPFIDLGDDGFDAWIEAKPARFRREVRRRRRRLEDDGGAFRFATQGTLERDVAEFMRLHRSRRAQRGGSNLTDGRVEAMLVEAGAELLPSERFRLLCLEMDGKTIAARLLLAAGEEVSAWNSGFDEEYATYSPSIQSMAHAVADACERGARSMSLGPGDQGYKYSLANRDEGLQSYVLLPRGTTYPLERLRLASARMRRRVGKRVPAKVKRWLPSNV